MCALKLRISLGLVALTLVLAVLFRSSTNMVQTITPLLARYTVRADLRQVGLLTSVFAAAIMLPAMTVNSWVRPWQIERAVVASMLLLCATFPLYAAAVWLWQLAVLVAAGGFASGIMQPFLLTAVTKYSAHERRERNLALFTVALSGGLLLGPLLETSVLRVDGENLSGVFVAFTGVMALALALSALLARAGHGQAAEAWRRPATLSRPSPVWWRLHALAGNRPYLLGFAGYLAYNIPYWVVLSFGGIYAHSAFGVSFGTVQLFFAAFFGASLVARLIVVALAPIARKRGALVMALALAAAGMVVLGVTHALALLVLAFVLLGIAHGVSYPLAAMLIAAHVQTDELGFANSVFNAAPAALGIVLPPVAGALIASAGYAATFLTSAGLVAGSVALLLGLRLPPGPDAPSRSASTQDAGAAATPSLGQAGT